MADDDNNAAEELPVEESTSSDIEQGRPSWVAAAAAITGGTLTVDPSTALGGLEHVDEEEAALVPFVQPIADMDMVEIKKGKIKKAKIMPSADVSTTPQCAMEQIEDGDDAAPRPFNYAEFDDDDPKPKLDSGEEESTDEDDGPPLPFTFGQQRDSLRDAKKIVATSQIISSSSAAAENILQRRFVEPENYSVSGNEGARQVVSSSSSSAAAAERYPSVPIIEAYLVEEDGPLTAVVETAPPTVPVVTTGGHDTVFEATPLEPELPWWKQRRNKEFMVVICVLLAALALAVGLGVAFSRPSSKSTGITITTTAPIAETGDSSSSSVSLSPSQSPTEPSYRCFADRNELKAAVDRYVKDGCRAVATLCRDLSDTYGWPMGSWCIIDVTDMSSLFKGLDTFNEDISMWNVSHVVDMSYMFKGATFFNQNLCAWQNSFPYSSATDIFVDSGCAYKGAPSSETKGPFCASACNTVSPTDCFTTRDELKAAVDRYVQGYWVAADSTKYGWPIGYWCVGKVTDMSGLFENLDTFNEDISGWEVSQVTIMKAMFRGASAFDGDISSWDTSAVTDTSWMFYEASSFNQNLSSWDTSAVTDMSFMFENAFAFDGSISSWNTSAVTNMEAVFAGASSFNQELSNWDTSAVTTMSGMFARASSFNPKDLTKWDTSAVTTMYVMFEQASSFDGNISSWNTSAVTDMSFMFSTASSFNQEDLSNWDTSAVINMKCMFQGASAFKGNVSSWNTSAVTDMSWMFFQASSFNQQALSMWDTSAVSDMRNMFYGASSFNQDLCAWKDNFPYNNADGIFEGSGCTFQSTPQIDQQGPFCASDCTNS
jgi:surface protein